MQYLLLISLLPVIILLFLVYKLDKKKEPKKMLLTSFLWGALISIPIVIVELILQVLLEWRLRCSFIEKFNRCLKNNQHLAL